MKTIVYKGILCEILDEPKNPIKPNNILLQGQKANGDGFQQYITLEQLKEAAPKKKATDSTWELKYNGVVEKRGTWILCDKKRKELMRAGTHTRFKFELE